MAEKANPTFNRYLYTPRKVFDKFTDRVEVRRQRDRLDHRSDMQTIVQSMKALQNQLTLLEEHVESHCQSIAPLKGTEDDHETTHPDEELV